METENWDETTAKDESLHAPAGTPIEVKSLVQDILKNGFIESSANISRFEALTRNRRIINAILEPLDLRLDLDELHGLAVLCVAEPTSANPDEIWSHPLVRRQRLTLEQSLLVAILRQAYVVQELESGIGVREVRVSLDELLSQLQIFFIDTGSDTKNHQRLLTLLDQLKPHGIVSEPDPLGEVTIRPLITRLANPETLTALLKQFRELGRKTETSRSQMENE